jgi:FkbM family methyltransferase
MAGHKWNDFLKSRLVILKDGGFNPINVLDIGANLGQFYKEFSSVFTESNILSIEGNPSCEEDLKLVNPNYLITLLGEKTGEAKFYLNPDYDKCSGGSIFKENTPYYQNCQEIILPIQTLDSLDKTFDYIKMDVQGAEFDIIKGGLKTIKECSFLQLELSVLKYNQGSALISEVTSYLFNLGFYLYDIDGLFYWDDKLNQVDLIFVNINKHPKILDL